MSGEGAGTFSRRPGPLSVPLVPAARRLCPQPPAERGWFRPGGRIVPCLCTALPVGQTTAILAPKQRRAICTGSNTACGSGSLSFQGSCFTGYKSREWGLHLTGGRSCKSLLPAVLQSAGVGRAPPAAGRRCCYKGSGGAKPRGPFGRLQQEAGQQPRFGAHADVLEGKAKTSAVGEARSGACCGSEGRPWALRAAKWQQSGLGARTPGSGARERVRAKRGGSKRAPAAQLLEAPLQQLGSAPSFTKPREILVGPAEASKQNRAGKHRCFYNNPALFPTGIISPL